MTLIWLFLPPVLMFLASFLHQKRWAQQMLPWTNLLVFIGILQLFMLPKPVVLWNHLLVADTLNTFVLLISALTSVAVTLALASLKMRVVILQRDLFRFYRFFGLFWIGLILAVLANHMGLFWIGLEMATLSTVYMIRTNQRPSALKQAWNYMIVGTVAISLVLFGIILIYMSAKQALGEDAMHFDVLAQHAEHLKQSSLFMLGFAITLLGLFLKMGFFPLGMWLPNIERAAFYPVAALFSGVLESAVMLGLFRFSDIATHINQTELLTLMLLFILLTLVTVSLMMLRVHDLMRLFSLSGIEHMALIALFWVSGAKLAAVMHLAAHTFMKPAMFLATGILEQRGHRPLAGMLYGYTGVQGRLFVLMTSSMMLGLIGLPPSPMFFTELLGLQGLFQHFSPLAASLLAVAVLIPLAVVFYRFVDSWQTLRHAPDPREDIAPKTLYWNELAALGLLSIATLMLLFPPVWHVLEQHL